MSQVSVSQAAKRLGVGIARVHQRIADGSLPATRVGTQWVIDEAALSALQRFPGRPLSRRSAWALVAASTANRQLLDGLAAAERARAQARLSRLLVLSLNADQTEEILVDVIASTLRSWLRNRADRCGYRASPRDLPDLRHDRRITLSGLSDHRSGVASGDIVEGYVSAEDADAIIGDYLLSPTKGRDHNVVLHVVAGETSAAGEPAPLLVAADLAEHRRPREEARALQIVQEIAQPAGTQTRRRRRAET